MACERHKTPLVTSASGVLVPKDVGKANGRVERTGTIQRTAGDFKFKLTGGTDQLTQNNAAAVVLATHRDTRIGCTSRCRGYTSELRCGRR